MNLRTAPAAAIVLLLAACNRPPEFPPLTPADSLAIIQENDAHRAELDRFHRQDLGSPFRRDSSASYSGIRWFPIDVRFRGQSVLHRHDRQDTVTIFGTKGEPRLHVRYGYFVLTLPDSNGAPQEVRLNVYKFTPADGQRYQLYRNHLNVWFTDATTGKETYHVGRYVDVGDENPDPEHLYTIDLNKAYNPYCAYSAMYSCAIPLPDDDVPLPIRAGEMKYHD
jgi:hypothetical protein